ncbi:cytochrome c [Fulvivirgaceae bacterium BMA10]|uniref:Cytochrome c n=1 Tax=Splendidivirga corallicola TaxID=3051826 RepID=A0ABT8KT03_9BACT|nr:cytochrome c [Fulvivirgaceae bacterium BMA10]
MQNNSTNIANGFLNTIAIVITCLTVMIACSSKGSEVTSADQGNDRRDQLKLKQYIIEGKQLYLQLCSNCHQNEGSGIGRLIPPVRNSDYLVENPARAICIIKHGISDSIIVNGTMYHQPMPANERLTNIEIAEIATYILNVMNDENKLITVQDVGEALKDCSATKSSLK